MSQWGRDGATGRRTPFAVNDCSIASDAKSQQHAIDITTAVDSTLEAVAACLVPSLFVVCGPDKF